MGTILIFLDLEDQDHFHF